MKVLTASTTTKNKLEGTYLNGASLRFIQDANGKWVVNTSVIDDPNFIEIKDKLQALAVIDFVQPVSNL